MDATNIADGIRHMVMGASNLVEPEFATRLMAVWSIN
jgi:hypothetical protein